MDIRPFTRGRHLERLRTRGDRDAEALHGVAVLSRLPIRRAEVIGTVVNKVWPEKYRRVREAVAKGLDNLGIRAVGVVPFKDILASPTVRDCTISWSAVGVNVLGNDPVFESKNELFAAHVLGAVA